MGKFLFLFFTNPAGNKKITCPITQNQILLASGRQAVNHAEHRLYNINTSRL